jgi:uncharacterized protein YndB with AHSA1/START domain
VTVYVAVPPAIAFEVFTNEVDLWWRQGPQFRIAGKRPGTLRFEGGPGGQLFETFDDGKQTRTFVTGRITAWDPPARFEFEWRGVNFKPHESTMVEVLFSASREGTLVTLEHRGWSALPADHPARHGQQGAAFSRMIGMWWGELLTSFRLHATRSA